MTPRRFIHINHRYSPFVGGSELWIQRLSEQLADSGHDVSVLTTTAFDLEYFWDPHAKSVDAPAREQLAGVRVVRVPIRHLPMSSFGFRASRRLMGEASRLPLPEWWFRAVSLIHPYAPELDRALRGARDVDLVHVTNLGLEGLAVRGAGEAIRRSIPFVLTPFVHLGVDGSSVARRYVTMPHQRELIRCAASVITMTGVERDFVAELRGCDEGIVVAGAGVDVASVTGGSARRFREMVGVSGSIVASIGAMARDKGTFDLVDAVTLMRRRGSAVELVLTGPPLQSFVRWFSRRSDADREGIHVLGFVSDETKRDLLAAMDVMALPSRTESFGIVYLEAWANEKPVVAADTPAARELVGESGAGVLAQFGEPESIAEALQTLLASSESRSQQGARGKALVEGQYTWAHVVQRAVKAYAIALDVDQAELIRA